MHDIVKTNDGDGRSNYMLQWLDAHAVGAVAKDAAPAGSEDDQEFVGRLYELCLRALQDFYRQQRDGSKSRSNVLRECLGRLYLWGEPFSVGDLDKALRQSDELRDDVFEHLNHIGKLLLRKSKLSIPPSKALRQPTKQIKQLESVMKLGKLIAHGKQDETEQSNNENDEQYDSGSDISSESGSCGTIEDINFATTCLMELGPCLEQNLKLAGSAQRRYSCLTSVPFTVSSPAMVYISSVREKFRQADYKLVERLGEANWQRHKAVREKIENTGLSLEERTKTGIACSLFRPYSDFHDSGIGSSVPAHIEYAPSHTSFQSSSIEADQGSLRVPREPSEVGAGKPFQCFLCNCIISNVRNRVDWKMHVFADLRPYICTFPDCHDELAQFTTRAAWADHEFTQHRFDRIWDCPECSKRFSGASDWERHLRGVHRRIFTGSQFHLARDTAYQMQLRPAETEECPLCRVVLGKPRRAFIKHIARHMEEIALMALPRSIEEDSDASSISTDQVSQGSKPTDTLSNDAQSEAHEVVSLQATAGSVPSISELPQDPAHGTDSEVEDYSIKCICGLKEDDGNTVYCASCDTRQHTECYYTDKYGNVPTKEELKVMNHICVDCQPIRRKTFNAAIVKDDQNDRHSTNETINQPELPSKGADESSPNRDDFLAASSEAALKAPLASGHKIVGNSIKSQQQASARSFPRTPSPPPRRPPRPRHWICGSCGEVGMSIRRDFFCCSLSCARRKDWSAIEY